MLKNNREELINFLEDQGKKEANDISLFECALAFSALRHPERSLDRYYHQIEKLKTETHNRIAEEGADHCEAQLNALKTTFVDHHNYLGNALHYDLIDNADICFVMDQAKGLPVALSILYLEVCERLEWEAEGVNFPGHFLMRLTANGQQLLFDPFNLARKIGAAELREIIKHIKGDDAELDQAYYQAATKREMLVRLQNNIKKRQIAAEDYEAALDTVLITEKVAPNEYRLLLDKGVLLAKNTKSKEAIETLEKYIALTPFPDDRADARMFIEQIYQDLI